MKYVVLLFSLLFCSGCAEKHIKYPADSFLSDVPNYLDGSISAVDFSIGSWICHRPGTEWHERECTEECYEEGNSSVFCWEVGGDRDAD